MSASEAIEASLGHRVVRVGAGSFQVQFLKRDEDRKSETYDHLIVARVQPTLPAHYEAYQEAVRMREDHDHACQDLWELYCAATGETIETFRGLPEGGAVEAVRRERERLLSMEQSKD